MSKKQRLLFAMTGFAAGAVSGLFGTGGGMVVVPLLGLFANIAEENIFPSSVSIILPICLVCLGITAFDSDLPLKVAFPYLIGSSLGGIAAGLWGKQISTLWLHRFLGILILWGGFRYLC